MDQAAAGEWGQDNTTDNSPNRMRSTLRAVPYTIPGNNGPTTVAPPKAPPLIWISNAARAASEVKRHQCETGYQWICAQGCEKNVDEKRTWIHYHQERHSLLLYMLRGRRRRDHAMATRHYATHRRKHMKTTYVMHAARIATTTMPRKSRAR